MTAHSSALSSHPRVSSSRFAGTRAFVHSTSRALACALPVVCALTAALLLTSIPALASARITIVNVNDPGEGFNDTTPAAPVGGNPGTTIGQQRLIAFQYAADIWGAALDSKIEIKIQASFVPLPCSGNSAVLGAAGALQIFTDFPGAEFPATWYPAALANRQAGVDQAPGPSGTDADDIEAVFSSRIDDPDCLGDIGWYYGLDNRHGANTDLVTVLLHEFAHGLGFESFVDLGSGENADPDHPEVTDIFSHRILDTGANLHWNEMTDDERRTSARAVRHVVWDGPAVTAAVPQVLQRGMPILTIQSPAPIAGQYLVGTAAFGQPLGSPGATGTVAQAIDPSDGSGASTFDACSPLTNPAEVAGKFALVDRGTCTFVVKARNVQAAGAAGMIAEDTAPGNPPPGIGGFDASITIPSIRITRATGDLIKAHLAEGVVVTLGLDLQRLAGADQANHPFLYATDPILFGSSISHWDTIELPNQLMEPNLNSDLTHRVSGVDLTLPHMRDIGWVADADLDGVPDASDRCPHSRSDSSVGIGVCATGIPNAPLEAGCTIGDRVDACASSARNHGGFVSCISRLSNDLRRDGIISNQQRGMMQRCAASSRIP